MNFPAASGGEIDPERLNPAQRLMIPHWGRGPGHSTAFMQKDPVFTQEETAFMQEAAP